MKALTCGRLCSGPSGMPGAVLDGVMQHSLTSGLRGSQNSNCGLLCGDDACQPETVKS